MASSEREATTAPLLEKKPQLYFDGCPGCAIDKRKAENPRIPYRLFFYIWTIILVSSMSAHITVVSLLIFHGDLHITKREEDIGFYAGFVGASYMLGRGLTSPAWGMIADRIGRKPVIILGISSVLVFNTLFGLSVHYWMALATRFLLGSLNGLLGPIRAYAVEVCQAEHQAIALSLVCTAWAIGLIIGPAIGGYLAQPAKKYPKLFHANSIFGRLPYFLPCLCVSIFCFVILLSCIWLPETLHKHKLDEKEDQSSRYPIADLSDSEDSVEQHNNSSTKNKSLYKNWKLMSSIILYCIVCFDDAAYTEVTVITCSFILQNNSLTQDQRAAANGLATTLMSFSKAISPSGAGIVFSWAQNVRMISSFRMVFFLLGIIVLVEIIWTFKPFLAVPEQFSLR